MGDWRSQEPIRITKDWLKGSDGKLFYFVQMTDGSGRVIAFRSMKAANEYVREDRRNRCSYSKEEDCLSPEEKVALNVTG